MLQYVESTGWVKNSAHLTPRRHLRRRQRLVVRKSLSRVEQDDVLVRGDDPALPAVVRRLHLPAAAEAAVPQTLFDDRRGLVDGRADAEATACGRAGEGTLGGEEEARDVGEEDERRGAEEERRARAPRRAIVDSSSSRARSRDERALAVEPEVLRVLPRRHRR